MTAHTQFDTGRAARTLVLIAIVTATFLLTASWRLEGRLFQIGAVVIGAIAVVTAITGFLIAAGATYDETQGL